MHENTAYESRWGKLNHWLENVFWYHYKWYYFAAVFALVLLTVSVVSFASRWSMTGRCNTCIPA